jgi:DNA-directed RNA polymerases I, II, and III subunit RPABC1
MNNFNKDIKLIKDTFQAYLNILEILKERGFVIIDNKILSLNIFLKKYEESSPFVFIYEHKRNKEKIYFSIFKESKITKKDLLNKIQLITEKNDYNNYLFLTSDVQILNYINEIKNKYNIDLQIFTIENLQINILKHELQPKFILLNSEEKQIFLDKNKWKENNLPKMKLDEPISRYYNAKSGQIFKIIRKNMVGRNKTSSQGIYYRIVIE